MKEEKLRFFGGRKGGWKIFTARIQLQGFYKSAKIIIRIRREKEF